MNNLRILSIISPDQNAYASAIASISTSAPKGRFATANAARAGGSWGKNFLYAPFTVEKSSIFFKKTVHLTILSIPLPASSRIAAIFRSAWAACGAAALSTNFPVDGSFPTCPEIKTNPFAMIAWEYGATGAGAFFVCTTFFFKSLALYVLLCFSYAVRLHVFYMNSRNRYVKNHNNGNIVTVL
jgi:hypothetical protein